MASNATPNEQCTARQDPHEASDSQSIPQDSLDPRNWVSAQQAIEEIDIEMNRFLSAKYSTQTPSDWGSYITMRLEYNEVVPDETATEIDNKDSTTSTGPAKVIAEFYVSGLFLYSPKEMRSVHRDFHLWHNDKLIPIRPDPARTPPAQIQDIAAFKRRCPFIRANDKWRLKPSCEGDGGRIEPAPIVTIHPTTST